MKNMWPMGLVVCVLWALFSTAFVGSTWMVASWTFFAAVTMMFFSFWYGHACGKEYEYHVKFVSPKQEAK